MATKVLGLISLAVCIVLAASTPTAPVRRDRSIDTYSDEAYFLTGLDSSTQAISDETNIVTNQSFTGVIEEEFNIPPDKVNVTLVMCQVVALYHLVKAVDNDSKIQYYLKQNALDALTYWNNTYCSDECADVDLLEFGRKCQRAALFSFMYRIIRTIVRPAGNYPDLCNWLTRMLQQQQLQGMYTCSQLAFGPFIDDCADC